MEYCVHSNISYKQKVRSRHTMRISPDGDFTGSGCLSGGQPQVGSAAVPGAVGALRRISGLFCAVPLP